MKVYKLPASYGWQQAKANYCKMAVEVDCEGITVVHIGGTQPNFIQLMCALLADDIVRNEIREYQDSYQAQDENLYKVFSRVGASDCQDIYLETASFKTGLGIVYPPKYLCHVSAYDKLQDKVFKLSFRQFIELASWTGIDDMTQDELMAKAEVQYFKAKAIDESYSKPVRLDV